MLKKIKSQNSKSHKSVAIGNWQPLLYFDFILFYGILFDTSQLEDFSTYTTVISYLKIESTLFY